MKRNLFAVIVCLLVTNLAFGQNYWTLTGSNIYNNNAGKVGVGNTSPTTLVDIGSATKSTLAASISNSNITGMQVRTINSANVSYQNFLGNMFFTAQTGTSTYGSMTGLTSWMTNSSSTNSYTSYNTITGMRGVAEQNTSPLTYAYGVRSDIISSGTSGLGIQNSYSFYALGAPAGVSTSYGLFIDASSAVSNKYGVYVNDGSAKNYFGGTVGIGTTSLGSFKLAVEGKIGAREVQVTASNPFPDYVFEKTYNLMSLDNLDQYVQINKHLPNIPSAKEVEENGGIELGKMNIKLVEKVEELTLYIIDLNKRLKHIEEENELLKNNKIK